MATFWSVLAGGGVVAALLMFWLKAYLEPYLKKKAENLATHEDIKRLVDQVRETERVKAEIADRMWDRQTRWNAKRDYYVTLIRHMCSLVEVLVRFIDKRESAVVTQLNSLSTELFTSATTSHLFMPEEVYTTFLESVQVLRKIIQMLHNDAPGPEVSEQVAVYNDKFWLFVKAARADLEA